MQFPKTESGESRNMNRPITSKKIESVIKNLLSKEKAQEKPKT
jgi:hypothetical protein